MFSLIIVLVSLVLVGAIALATLYYGSNAASAHSQVTGARLANEASQIQAAVIAHRAHTGSSVNDIASLVSAGYLQAVPQPNWHAYNGVAVFTNATLDQCEALNKSLGLSGPVPSCTDPDVAGKELCCSQE